MLTSTTGAYPKVRGRGKQPKLPPVPESAILSACIKWLWLHGVFCWRNNTGGTKFTYTRKDGSTGHSNVRFGYPGSSDIIGINKHGRMVCVETKREGKGLEPQQEKFRDTILEHGGVFVLARSVDDLEARKTEILGALHG